MSSPQTTAGPAEAATASATEAWQSERGRLLGIAYRMLGDFGEAEDIVSEVAVEALRHERTAGETVRSWPKWLTTVCVRRSIDRVRRLASAREEYPGPWMPEPVSAEARAALILHRAFELTAPEIGVILDRSAASVRQLVSRAERRLRETGHLAEAAATGRESQRQSIARLQTAIVDGDLEAVVDLLAPEAVLWADGGGKVRSALNPIFGAERIARFFTGIRERSHRLHPEATFRLSRARLAAETGLLLHHYGRSDLLTVEVRSDGRVTEIRLVSNPDKLGRMRPGATGS